MKKLTEVVTDDLVWCGGDSGFCQDDIEKVVDVIVKYDENTGIPYNVIILNGDRRFDSRNGVALNPPTAYYIKAVN
jgi:hypothetical protein